MADRSSDASQTGDPHVVVVARSPVVAAGVAALLGQAGFSAAVEPVGGFSDSVSIGNPDVVVIDTSPDPDDAADALLLAEFRGVPAVLLVDALPPEVRSVDPARPAAWLRRNAGQDELAAAVRAVAAGLHVYDPALEDRAATPSLLGGIEDDEIGTGPLTSREVEVLRKLSDGLTNKAIAYDLGISEHTVKYHVGSILSKLDVAGRTEAVTVAARRGLIAL